MATELPEDTQLKRRARRRLIGAIALVLLAVIVLPMIFDAEKKPLDQDVSIQIPSQGDYVATAPKPAAVVPAPVQPAPPADAKADAGKDGAPKADAAKGDNPKDAKADAPKSDAPKAEAPKAEAPKAEAPKAAAPVKPEVAKAEAPKAEAPKAEAPKAPAKAEAPRVAAKSDEQKAKEKADAERALALLNGATTAPKSEKAEKPAAGSFIVQVAAFSNEEKVQEARDKLSAAGVKTYAEKVSVKGGEVTRVRAGPYASRDAADAARGKIAGLGFGTATVVTR